MKRDRQVAVSPPQVAVSLNHNRSFFRRPRPALAERDEARRGTGGGVRDVQSECRDAARGKLARTRGVGEVAYGVFTEEPVGSGSFFSSLLGWSSASTSFFSNTVTPLPFVACHDTTRLTSPTPRT
jgi:hypothetical protein